MVFHPDDQISAESQEIQQPPRKLPRSSQRRTHWDVPKVGPPERGGEATRNAGGHA